MYKKTSILAFLFISFCFLVNISVAEDGYDHKHHYNDYEDDTTGGAAGGMETDSQLLIVKITGENISYRKAVPNFEEEALCFDIDLFDYKTHKIIGEVTDCISDLKSDGMGGIDFVGTTFLHFPDGTIVTQGDVTVQPVVGETTLRTGQRITNITGSATTGNTFVEGESTGIYANRTGNTRISGMINTENFTADPAGGEPQFFDCIFEIELDTVVE
jgi:hypothetical protein